MKLKWKPAFYSLAVSMIFVSGAAPTRSDELPKSRAELDSVIDADFARVNATLPREVAPEHFGPGRPQRQHSYL